MTLLLWLLAILLIVVGLIGTVLPALPGTLLIFAGLCLGAYAEGFNEVGLWTLLVLGILTALSYAIDFIATALGAKRTGASAKAFWGAALGSIVGVFFGIPGLILGPFLGAVIGELIARRGFGDAARAGYGAWIGLMIGTVAKLTLAFLMVGIFILMRVF